MEYLDIFEGLRTLLLLVLLLVLLLLLLHLLHFDGGFEPKTGFLGCNFSVPTTC